MLVELLACFSTEELLRESDVFPRTGGLNHCCSTHVCSDLRGGEITQAGFFFVFVLQVFTRTPLCGCFTLGSNRPHPSSPSRLLEDSNARLFLFVRWGGGTERCLEQHPFLGHHTNTLGADLRTHESAVRGALT